MKLSEVKYNEIVVVQKILGYGSFRRRITEMGFVRGKEVRIIKNAPFKGPIEVKILNYNVSLRMSEAELIEVLPVNADALDELKLFEGIINGRLARQNQKDREKLINVALVGNPNSGKTTLFNSISGSREKVGNYSGVTVDIKKTTFNSKGYTFNFFDLPGTYSLTTWSPEEIFVRRFIYEQTPDVVINVVDSTNLERNLFLTTQLIDMDLRIVVALNMFDELEKKKIQLDYRNLSKLMGIPFVPTINSKGAGISELLDRIITVFEGRDEYSRHIHINYGTNLELSIGFIREKLRDNNAITDKISSRFLALKLLESDEQVMELFSAFPNFSEIREISEKESIRIQELEKEDSSTVIANAKYGFIHGALRETLSQPAISFRSGSEKIDYLLTHPVWGFPIFGIILFIVFFGTFKLGDYPVAWIESLVSGTGNVISKNMAAGMLRDLLVNGIISGAGSVLVFLPNILILFMFISLLEETGYMARASFIMDKVMHRFGLHGRSFIPLIMGFGCNVPAIMATRTLRNRGDRILTMLIIPFMSCSARLPVYILIISALFTSHHALYLLSVYMLGIILAFLTAQMLNKTIFRNKETPFVMELPPYRLPTIRNVIYHMWDKTRQYLRKIGGVILAGVIIIWALGYFPREKISAVPNKSSLSEENAIISNQHRMTDPVISDSDMEAVKLSNSYLGRIGNFIRPVMQPLGFDWKMSISLIAGLPAKEIIVSTMGVLYQAEDENWAGLQANLKDEVHLKGKLKGEKVFSIPAALAFLVFILIYFPCIGVVATIKNESGHWKWAIFTIVYTTALAWIFAFLVYNIAGFFT